MALSFAGGTYLPPPPGVGIRCSWYAEIFKEKTDTSPFRASWESLLCHVVPSAAAGFFSSSFESLVSRSCWDQMGSTTTPAITWLSAHYESDKVCFFNTSQGILHMSWSLFDSIFVSFWSLTSRPRHWTVFLELLVEPQNAWHFVDVLSTSSHPGHPNITTIWNLNWKQLLRATGKNWQFYHQSPVEDFISKLVFKKNTHLAGFLWCTQFKKLCEMVQ